MNIKSVISHTNKISIKRHVGIGRYERRRQREYFHTNNTKFHIVVKNTSQCKGFLFKRSNCENNEVLNIALNHVHIGDFVRVKKETIYVMYFITSKQKDVPLTNGEKAEIIGISEKGKEYQGVSKVGYGIKIKNENQVKELVQSIKEVKKGDLKNEQVLEDIKKLGEKIESGKFILIGENKMYKFNINKFDFANKKTKSELFMRYREIAKNMNKDD